MGGAVGLPALLENIRRSVFPAEVVLGVRIDREAAESRTPGVKKGMDSFYSVCFLLGASSLLWKDWLA